MLGLSRKKAGPIGIDLGSSSLKMVQLRTGAQSVELVAAAQTQVPPDIQGNMRALHDWQAHTIRHLLSSRSFRGKRVVTCLPSRDLLIQHLRLPKMNEKQLSEALIAQAQQKLSFSVDRALLRHIVAGEVYDGREAKLEVILMAAGDEVVHRHLELIERTRVEIESVNVEPCALLSAFSSLLQQENEEDSASMFIDLGHAVTKIVVAHGVHMAFGRTLSIGGRHLFQSQQNQPASGSAGASAPKMSSAMTSLCEDIRHCIRYHDSVFENRPVKKVVFLGGLTKNTTLCRQLAQTVGLPAQLGDPLARLSETTCIGPHSDLVPGENHSEWSIAFGLSLAGLHSPAKSNAKGGMLSYCKKKVQAATV